QAAKNPVGYRNKFTGRFFTLQQQPDAATDAVVYEPVFLAAPVLPKQPEHSRQHFESLCNQFWNWAELDEIDQDEEPRLEWNGSNYTHRVTAALWKMYQAAPAQPVSEPYKLPDGYLLLPRVPTQAHLNSIAMRYRHDFYLLNDAQKQGALAVARQ
nr:hypothetical protein [Escherichia coli]